MYVIKNKIRHSADYIQLKVMNRSPSMRPNCPSLNHLYWFRSVCLRYCAGKFEIKDAMRFAQVQETRTFFDLVMQFLVARFAFARWHICGAGIYIIFQSCCAEDGSVSQIWLMIALKARPSSAKYAPRLSLVLCGDNRPNHPWAVNPKNSGTSYNKPFLNTLRALP